MTTTGTVSELHSETDAHILFRSEGSFLRFEKNVGQCSFTDSPSPNTDVLVVDVDGDTWFLNQEGARRLSAWLTRVLV